MATVADGQNQQKSDPPTRSDPGWWAIALIVLFAGGILVAIAMDAQALTRLADPAYARGLITWLVILTTIGIAFVLIYQAFNGSQQSDDGFRRAREVFAGLLGLAGTIIGFYFGSAEKGEAMLRVSDPAQEGQTIRAYVSGGTPPYRYTIESLDRALIKANDKPGTSDNGWIKYELSVVPTGSTTLTITVTDAKNLKGSAKLEVKAATKPEDAPDKAKNPTVSTAAPVPNKGVTPVPTGASSEPAGASSGAEGTRK